MALSKLESLLAQNAINPSETFKTKMFVMSLGEEIEIEYKRVTNKQYMYYRKSCAVVTKRGAFDFNMEKYRHMIIADCMVSPNFLNVEFQAALSTHSPEDAIQAVFLPGEIVALADYILSQSGFDSDPFRGGNGDNEGTTEE